MYWKSYVRGEPEYSTEMVAVESDSGDLIKRRDDYNRPKMAPLRYKCLEDLSRVMRANVLGEYHIEMEKMKKLKLKNKNITLDFLKEKTLDVRPARGQGKYVWKSSVTVPENFLEKEETNNYSSGHVNTGDELKIYLSRYERGKYIFNEFNSEEDAEDEESAYIVIFGKVTELIKNYRKVNFTVELTCNEQHLNFTGQKMRFTAEWIQFIPSDVVFKRRLQALKSLPTMINSPNILRVVCGKKPVGGPTQPFIGNLSALKLTPTQKEIVKSVAVKAVSIIQGPPGTGKTHTIAAIVYALLQQHAGERILVCGPSNQSVENLVEEVAILTESLGKKCVWLASNRKDFKLNEKISNAQKYLMYNLMLNRDTVEGRRFAELQHIASTQTLDPDLLTESDSLRKTLEKNISFEADVILCTLETSGKKCLNKILIPTVIIDEATQAVEPSTYVPLIHGGKRLILVGDQMQLGPVVPRDDLFKNVNYNVSLFERCVKLDILEKHFLDAQFRMHPDISKFSNVNFYEGKIKNMVSRKDRENLPPWLKDHVIFIDVNGHEKSVASSFVNEKEATVAMKVATRLLSSYVSPDDIGIASPYAEQAKYLRMIDCVVNESKVKISSVDSFQGSQKDYFIISTVRSNKNVGFLKDIRRLNVALTRARRCVMVIGDSKTLMKDKYWRNYVEYCKSLKSYYIGAIGNKPPKSVQPIAQEKVGSKRRKNSRKRANPKV